VGSIEVPHTAVRFILYGYRFTRNLSAQVSYLRPVTFARYNNVDDDKISHNVWMSIGGLTFTADLPITNRFSFTGEAGLGVLTRRGFSANGVVAMRNTSYANFLLGGAFRYRVGRKWQLQLGTTWSPAEANAKQPATLFHSAGFNYCLTPLSEERVNRNEKARHHFPHQFLYVGVTTNTFGYGINDAVSKGTIPIFWGGEAHVKNGITINYQRNIFHARKVFSFDWAASAGMWSSRDLNQKFITLSFSPVMRFTAIRTKPVDLSIEYSVAGPTFISRPVIDNKKTGGRFTFYDFMGLQAVAGKKKNLLAGLRIAHFSNGNMLPDNEGVMVPLTLNLGYVF
jgi:hypothetical protein